MTIKPAVIHCDACDARLYAEDESRERWFVLQTPHNRRDLEICRDCWSKMCAAVGLDPATDAPSKDYVR